MMFSVGEGELVMTASASIRVCPFWGLKYVSFWMNEGITAEESTKLAETGPASGNWTPSDFSLVYIVLT